MPYLGGRITVIAVGKLRKSHWQDAQEIYETRLHRYTNFELIEVKDYVGRGMADGSAMQKEGELLLKGAEPAYRKIALTPSGCQMSSRRLAKYLQRQVRLYSHVAFLVGGPLGFSEEVLLACDEQLSLSRLTLPHELARVVLLEQLYRAGTIINNESYHK